VAWPYDGLTNDTWESKTEGLIAAHPIDTAQIVDVVQTASSAIFDSNLAGIRVRVAAIQGWGRRVN
jgi:hypothetical protein